MEGSVAWNNYCPKCKNSTRSNFGFGKTRLCAECEALEAEYNSLSEQELWELEYKIKEELK